MSTALLYASAAALAVACLTPSSKSAQKNNYQAPQNKTGSYGEKRRPGDYLR
jgi:hypothetical protein